LVARVVTTGQSPIHKAARRTLGLGGAHVGGLAIGKRLQLLSFWPISAMPSPRLLKNFPVSFVLTLPAFLRPSTEACVPSCNLVPDHLAAPSRLAPAFLSPSVA